MRPIQANNLILTQDKNQTYISVDIDAVSSTLTVDSITGFAVNQILLIGEFGSEASEIIKTSASTAPSGSTITLLNNTVHEHLQGSKVTVLDWDQVEFSYASTEAGAKTVLSTASIRADADFTQYTDTTYSGGYYFIRFKNSISGIYSDYSDPIPWVGFGSNTVGACIEYALKRNKTDFTDNVDHEFCIEEIKNCLQDIAGTRKRWMQWQEFDYLFGQTARGIYRIALPSTMWQYSNRALLDLRMQGQQALNYKDEIEWQDLLDGVKHNTLKIGAAVGATSITVDNSYDFSDTGSLLIKGQSITYTAKDNATGVISGIPASGTGSITAVIAAGDDVWQGASEGCPEDFTIKDGYMYYWPLASAQYAGKNIYGDFWKVAPTVDSDGDEIEAPRYDMAKYWLTWAIRSQLKNDGMRDVNDADYQAYLRGLSAANRIENNSSGQKFKQKPKLNTMFMD